MVGLICLQLKDWSRFIIMVYLLRPSRGLLSPRSSRLQSSLFGVFSDGGFPRWQAQSRCISPFTSGTISPFDGRSVGRSRVSRTARLFSTLSSKDEEFLMQAVEYAKNGKGHTFPNPAVGCLLVREPLPGAADDQPTIIGRGFHPRAGYPHAEIFALFEAAGHVPNGVEAARSIVDMKEDQSSSSSSSVVATVNNLLEAYASENGAEKLFANVLQAEKDQGPVTAYVTLEPCCHYGKTPPCALSLSVAGVHRVVVGFRDPNPKVDGGGVQLLEETAGVQVDMAESGSKVHEACHDLVDNFVKRISPNPLRDDVDYSWMTGSMRMALRSLSNKRKSGGDGTLTEISWGGPSIEVTNENADQLDELIERLPLSAEWMEHVDEALWRDEMILLRLNKAIKKKKGVKLLGTKVASILKATVAQTVGHCALIYRPSSPPVMDLGQMVSKYKRQQEEKDQAKEDRRKEWENREQQKQDS